MTNYGAWSSFNEDEELSRTESRFQVEDFKDEQKRVLNNSMKDLQESSRNAQRTASALKSRAQVEALRAAEAEGRASHRRRNKTPHQEKEVVENHLSLDSKPSHVEEQVLRYDAPTDVSNLSQSTENVKQHSRDGAEMIVQLTNFMNDCTRLFSDILSRSDELNRLCLSSTSVPSNSGDEIGARACKLGLEVIRDLENFVHTKLEQAKSAGNVALSAGLLNDVQTCTRVINNIGDSVGRLTLQVTAQTSLIALQMRQYALCCDITRMWLKRHETSPDAERALGLAKDKAKGVEAHPLMADTKAVAVMWMTRALAFAGMGCPYLANVHARKAHLVFESYPRAELITSALDAYEMGQMLRYHESSLESLVAEQIHALIRAYRISLKQDLNDGRVLSSVSPHNLSTDILASLLGPAAQPLAAEATFTPLSTLLMSEQEDIVSNGSDSTENIQASENGNCATVTSCPDLSVAAVRAELCGSTIGPFVLDMLVLFRVIHEFFYQAQLLYLEQMYLSAETRYLAVTLVCALALGQWEDLTEDSPPLASSLGDACSAQNYLKAVQVSCLLNAGVCRVRHSGFASRFQSGAELRSLNLQSSSLSVRTLVEGSALHLCQWGLSAAKNICLNVSFFASGSLRATYVYETMGRFDEALSLINDLECAVRKSDIPVVNADGDVSKSCLLKGRVPFVINSSSLHAYSQQFLALSDTSAGTDTSQDEVVSMDEQTDLLKHLEVLRQRLVFKRTKYYGKQ